VSGQGATTMPVRKPWCVVIRKESTSADVVFSAYTTQEEADLVCSRLTGNAMPARVQLGRSPSVVPGTTLHLPRRDRSSPR